KRRELPDAGNVPAGEHDREPADDREKDRDRPEQASLAAERCPGVAARQSSAADAAYEDQVRNGQNQPERGRQPVSIRERGRHADRHGIHHPETISKAGGRGPRKRFIIRPWATTRLSPSWMTERQD